MEIENNTTRDYKVALAEGFSDFLQNGHRRRIDESDKQDREALIRGGAERGVRPDDKTNGD